MSREFTTFDEVIRQAIRRARVDRGLEQAQLAHRMRSLHHAWHPQTVSGVETGKRRVGAEELLPLSLCLEVPMSYLLRPQSGLNAPQTVALTQDVVMPAQLVDRSAGDGRYEQWIRWTAENEPIWPSAEDRAELEARLTTAREARDEARDQYQRLVDANAMGGHIAKALYQVDVWETEAQNIQRRLRLLGVADGTDTTIEDLRRSLEEAADQPTGGDE